MEGLGELEVSFDFMLGYPGGSDYKESACNMEASLDPWIGKISWKKKKKGMYYLKYFAQNSMDREPNEATVNKDKQKRVELIEASSL